MRVLVLLAVVSTACATAFVGTAPVQVTKQGTLDPQIIDAQIATLPTPLQQCVNYAVGAGEGELEYDFVIAEDGTVRAVSLVRDTIKNDALATCMGNKIGHWTFPAPAGGEVLHGYSSEIRRDHRKPGAGASDEDRYLSWALEQNSNDVQRCITRFATGEAAGTMHLRWTFTTRGTATNVQVVRDEIGNAPLTQCVVDSIRGWTVDPIPKKDITLDWGMRLTH